MKNKSDTNKDIFKLYTKYNKKIKKKDLNKEINKLLDSLKLINLYLDVEKKFSIKIGLNELEKIKKLSDLTNLINKKIK
jgi:acyl carrier protein